MEDFDLGISGLGPSLITPEGYKNLQAELEHLTVVKRGEIAERLRESKNHGEFSEDNSELDEVKSEQAIVENRINALKALFATAQILELDSVPTEYVGIGSWVKVKDLDRPVEFEVRIVSSFEADPDEDLISYDSPMGTSLYGKKVGEDAIFNAPAGKIRYQVVSIRR